MPAATNIATCPKCGGAITDQHSYGWCQDCGEPLPSDITARLPRLQAIHAAAAAASGVAQRALSPAETIEKHIKGAWIAATVCGSITLLVVACTLAGAEIVPGCNGWSLIDVAILFGLAFGVAKRSRICALLLVTYGIFNEGLMIASDLKASPLRLYFALILIYFFIRGAIASFQYHTARKASIAPVAAPAS